MGHMAKLTKRKVDVLPLREREYLEWDEDLGGFACRVHPSGRKTFVFRYRVGGGRRGLQRNVTLGRYGEGFTVDQARLKARHLAAQVLKGEDPGGQRQEQRLAVTLDEFSTRYIREHATPMKKAASAKSDQWMLNRYLLPKLGTRKVVDITSGDVTKFVLGLSDRPILANRCRALLSKMLSLSISWGVRRDPVNPVNMVKKFPERSRERFLSSEERAKLGDTLRAIEADASEPWQAIAAIRLLLLTGCRRGEILSLKWEHIDYDNKAFLLPESKTGRKTIYLSKPVLEILAALPRKENCPYVLPARFNDGHFQGVGHVWERIRRTAGLSNVRIHDLRHTYASTGVGLRLGLPQIGGLLGHSRATTTAKYAHLAADPLREAGDLVARQLQADLDRGVNVIPFDDRKRPGTRLSAKVISPHTTRM
jgi:integrase